MQLKLSKLQRILPLEVNYILSIVYDGPIWFVRMETLAWILIQFLAFKIFFKGIYTPNNNLFGSSST